MEPEGGGDAAGFGGGGGGGGGMEPSLVLSRLKQELRVVLEQHALLEPDFPLILKIVTRLASSDAQAFSSRDETSSAARILCRLFPYLLERTNAALLETCVRLLYAFVRGEAGTGLGKFFEFFEETIALLLALHRQGLGCSSTVVSMTVPAYGGFLALCAGDLAGGVAAGGGGVAAAHVFEVRSLMSLNWLRTNFTRLAGLLVEAMPTFAIDAGRKCVWAVLCVQLASTFPPLKEAREASKFLVV
jgi:hypothetical protein